MKEQDDDASLVDSLELLELLSQQIRQELRHEALVELAMEAERPAEAGQDHFSSMRPWTYEDNLAPPQSSSQVIKRVASYTV